MRPMYQILRGHLDYDQKNDSTIPLPVDYVLENNLSMEKYQEWIPNVLFKDPELLKHKLVNDEKLKAFKSIKRKYFLVCVHNCISPPKH